MNANEQEMNLKGLALDFPLNLFDHKLSSLSPPKHAPGEGFPEVCSD